MNFQVLYINHDKMNGNKYIHQVGKPQKMWEEALAILTAEKAKPIDRGGPFFHRYAIELVEPGEEQPKPLIIEGCIVTIDMPGFRIG